MCHLGKEFLPLKYKIRSFVRCISEMLKCVKRAPSNLWHYRIRDKKPKSQSGGGCISRYGTCKTDCCAGVNVDVKLYQHRIVSTLAERSV